MITIRDLLDKGDPYAMKLLEDFTKGNMGFEEYVYRNKKYIETLETPEDAYDRAMGVI